MDKRASQRHAKRTWHMAERLRKHPWSMVTPTRHTSTGQIETPARRRLRKQMCLPIVRPENMSLIDYVAALPRIRNLLTRLERFGLRY